MSGRSRHVEFSIPTFVIGVFQHAVFQISSSEAVTCRHAQLTILRFIYRFQIAVSFFILPILAIYSSPIDSR